MVGIYDMEADVTFEYLGDEAVDRAPACDHDVKDLGTVCVLFEQLSNASI
jgi:hypothetical protein